MILNELIFVKQTFRIETLGKSAGLDELQNGEYLNYIMNNHNSLYNDTRL